MTGPDRGRIGSRNAAAWLVAGMVLAQLAAAAVGPFRADDWINLERGAIAWSSEWRTIWTSLNPFTLYRPIVDLWHGAMLRTFGLEPRPMLVALIALLLLQSWMLARLVRARGGSRETAALAAALAWAQPNATSWTTLWVSNVTGSLMTTFVLLALLLHHRAVRQSSRGRSPGVSIVGMLVAFVVAALCKEESVLVVGILGALELARLPRLGPRARRGAIVSALSLTAVTAGYVLFRTQVVPTPQEGDTRYHLQVGAHVLRNLAFFALHLGALPATSLVATALFARAAFGSAERVGDRWDHASREVLAGVAWAVTALLLYLPIGGRPAYGYLYAPSLAIAYATAHALGWAWSTRGRSPVPVALAHAALALALTGVALAGIGWPRYRALTTAAFARLDRDWPAPPAGARALVLDIGERETFSGRTLYNLVFDGAMGSAIRLHYGRPDLDAVTLYGADARAARERGEPAADAVFEAREGRLVRIAWPPPAARAERNVP